MAQELHLLFFLKKEQQLALQLTANPPTALGIVRVVSVECFFEANTWLAHGQSSTDERLPPGIKHAELQGRLQAALVAAQQAAARQQETGP